MSTPRKRSGSRVAAATQAAFESPTALAELRSGILDHIGMPHGIGILYGIGFLQGIIDGMRVAQGFQGFLRPEPRIAGCAIPLLFTPASGAIAQRFDGTLDDSIEASLHLRVSPSTGNPVCHVGAGYAAGWYSAIRGEFLLVRETQCRAAGAETCRFEADTAAQWETRGDTWAREMLAFVDYERLHKRALDRVGELEKQAKPSGMLGGFDPMSPAVHIWGPVMVLPYGGFVDCIDALDTIREDLGPGHVQVVVVDATGAKIDGPEEVGLLRLIDRLEEDRVEPIVAGLPNAIRRRLLPDGLPGLPLWAPDIETGITLAFQLCHTPR